MTLLDALRRDPVLAILRAPRADRFAEVARVLYDAGVRNLELTLTTPGALAALADVRAVLPAEANLGVGTVLSPGDVDAAVEAGAGYLISPDFRAAVVARAVERGVPSVPGALTPTEVAAAWEAGATVVKVFPASAVGGPAYLRALRGPLPDIPLLPTGGIDVAEVGRYLAAGAVGVGLGSPLVGDACEAGGDLDALYDRAKRAVAAAEAR